MSTSAPHGPRPPNQRSVLEPTVFFNWREPRKDSTCHFLVHGCCEMKVQSNRGTLRSLPTLLADWVLRNPIPMRTLPRGPLSKSYGGASLITKRLFLGPRRRPMPRALG